MVNGVVGDVVVVVVVVGGEVLVVDIGEVVVDTMVVGGITQVHVACVGQRQVVKLSVKVVD